MRERQKGWLALAGLAAGKVASVSALFLAMAGVYLITYWLSIADSIL